MAERGRDILALIPAIGDDKIDKLVALAKENDKNAARAYIKANQDPFGNYSADGSDANTDDESFITDANLLLIRKAAADRILAFIQSKVDALADLNDADNLASVTAIAKATDLANLAGAHAEVAKFQEASIDKDAVEALKHATAANLKALQEAAAKQLAKHIQTQLPHANKTQAEKLALLATTQKDGLNGEADNIAQQIGGHVTEDMVKGLKHCPDAEYKALQTAAADKVVDFVKQDANLGAADNNAKLQQLAELARTAQGGIKAKANAIQDKLGDDVNKAMIESLENCTRADYQAVQTAAANKIADFLKRVVNRHGDDVTKLKALELLATTDKDAVAGDAALLGQLASIDGTNLDATILNALKAADPANYQALQQAAAKEVVKQKFTAAITTDAVDVDQLQKFAEADPADVANLPSEVLGLISKDLMDSYKAAGDATDLKDYQKAAAKAVLLHRIKESKDAEALMKISASTDVKTDVVAALGAHGSLGFADDAAAPRRGDLRGLLEDGEHAAYKQAAQERAAKLLSTEIATIGQTLDLKDPNAVDIMMGHFNTVLDGRTNINTGDNLWNHHFNSHTALTTLLAVTGNHLEIRKCENLTKALGDSADQIKVVRKALAKRALSLKLKDPRVTQEDKLKLVENFEQAIANQPNLALTAAGSHIGDALKTAGALDVDPDQKDIRRDLLVQHLEVQLKAHESQRAVLADLANLHPKTPDNIRNCLKKDANRKALGLRTPTDADIVDAGKIDELITDDIATALQQQAEKNLQLLDDAKDLGVDLDIAAPMKALQDKQDAALQSREATYKDILSDPTQPEAELEKAIKALNGLVDGSDVVSDVEVKARHLKANNLSKLIYGEESTPTTELAILRILEQGDPNDVLTQDNIAALSSAYTHLDNAPAPQGIKQILTAIQGQTGVNFADIDVTVSKRRFKNLSMHIFGTEKYADQLAEAHAQHQGEFDQDIDSLLNRDYSDQPPFDEAGRQAALDRIQTNFLAKVPNQGRDGELPLLPYVLGTPPTVDQGKRDKYAANADINAASHFIAEHKDQTFPPLSRNYEDGHRAFKRAHKTLEEDYKAAMEKANKDAGRGFYSLSGRGYQEGAAIAGNIAVALPRNVGAFALGLAANVGTLFLVNFFKDARKFLYSTAPGIYSFGSESKMLEHTQEMLKAMQNEHASIIHKAFIDNQREHIDKSTQSLDVAANNLHQRLWEIQKRMRALPEDATASDIKEMRKALVKKEKAVKSELESIKDLHEVLKETSKLIEERKDITSYGFEHLESQVYNASDSASFMDMASARIDSDGNTGVAIRQQSAIGASDPTLKGVKAGQDVKVEFIGHRYRIDAGGGRYKHINIKQSVDNKSFSLVSDTSLTYNSAGKDPQRKQSYTGQDAEHDAKAVMQMARLALNCKTEADLLKDPLIVSGKNERQKQLAMASLFLVAEELGLKLDDRHIKCTTPGYNKAKAMEKANEKPAAGEQQSIESFAKLAQQETRKMSEKRKGSAEDLSHHTKKGKAHLKSIQGKAEKEEKHSELDDSKPTGLGRGGR